MYESQVICRETFRPPGSSSVTKLKSTEEKVANIQYMLHRSFTIVIHEYNFRLGRRLQV